MTVTALVPRTADEVVELLSSAGRRTGTLLIGNELEMGVIRARDLRPATYEGPEGQGALLQRLLERGGYEPVREGEALIGLVHEDGHRLSLEPGGQLELSTAPARTLVDLDRALREGASRLAAEAEALGLWLMGGGLVPAAQEDAPWMPKGRYRIMRAYFAALGVPGKLAHHMMQRTLSTQTTIDYRDGDDARELLELGNRIVPIAAAALACAPLDGLRESGLRSLRAEIWRFTDPSRQAEMGAALEGPQALRRYADAVLDAPMMFRVRRGEYLPMHGASFRRVLAAGRWPDGEDVRVEDVWTHLSSVFPDVRLKRGLVELRATDAQLPSEPTTAPALWWGLLGDERARADAAALLRPVDAAARDAARAELPSAALHGSLAGRPLLTWARELTSIARAGLERLEGPRAADLLLPLERRLAAGRCPADDLLDAWRGPLGQDPRRLIEHLRILPR